jgi:hypothetical protein
LSKGRKQLFLRPTKATLARPDFGQAFITTITAALLVGPQGLGGVPLSWLAFGISVLKTSSQQSTLDTVKRTGMRHLAREF